MLWSLLLNSLSIGSVYALLALGYSLIFATSGLLNFALGDIATVGAFVGLTVMVTVKLPYPLAALIAVLAAATVSVLMERLLLRPIARRGGHSINLLICTLGVAIVIRNAVQLIWGAEAQVMPSLFGDRLYRLGPVSINPQYLFILVVGLLVMAALSLFLTYTKPGRAMRAVAQDRRAASLMGVNVTRSTTLAYALSGAIAGAAGVLIAPILFASASMGAQIGLKGFTAAVVGGLGNLQGAVAGGLTLAVVEALGAGFLRSGYRDAVAFAVLILVLWLRPGGLLTRRATEKV